LGGRKLFAHFEHIDGFWLAILSLYSRGGKSANFSTNEPISRHQPEIEPKMFLDTQPSTIEFIGNQISIWLNGLTLPVIAVAAWKTFSWVKNKEQEGKAVIASAFAEIEIIKTNHLPHMQASLDGLKTGQDETLKQMNENTKDLVAAINNSKDALVNAFLASKN
jgi:hypothetical protein